MTNLAHGLAGLALILSFALLGQQRLRPMLRVCAVQAVTAALVVLLLRDLRLALFASGAFALNGLLLPLVVYRQTGDEHVRCAGSASWIGGVILAAVSVATAMQVFSGERVELLGAALAVLLLGLLQSARSPMTGLLSAQNGLILLVAAVPHVAPIALVAVVIPVVPATLILASRQQPMPPSWRFGAPIAAASTTLLFLLACGMLWQTPLRIWVLNVAPPNTFLVLLVVFVAMIASCLDLYEVQSSRLGHASFLLLIGCVVLALLSDEPAVTWLALMFAMVTSVRAEPAAFVTSTAGMLLALAGTLLLYFAAGSAALSWSGAPIANHRALNPAGVFLLVGYGAFVARVPSPKADAMCLLATVPLLVMLRLRQLGLAPELLLALGLATLLVALVSLRRAEMAVGPSVMAVLGLIVFALGLGEATAALLLIALLSLAAVVWTQRFAKLFLAALPLFALYLMADATVSRSIWLLPPLALGAIAASIMTVR